MRRLGLVLLLALAVAGCAGSPQEVDTGGAPATTGRVARALVSDDPADTAPGTTAPVEDPGTTTVPDPNAEPSSSTTSTVTGPSTTSTIPRTTTTVSGGPGPSTPANPGPSTSTATPVTSSTTAPPRPEQVTDAEAAALSQANAAGQLRTYQDAVTIIGGPGTPTGPSSWRWDGYGCVASVDLEVKPTGVTLAVAGVKGCHP